MKSCLALLSSQGPKELSFLSKGCRDFDQGAPASLEPLFPEEWWQRGLGIEVVLFWGLTLKLSWWRLLSRFSLICTIHVLIHGSYRKMLICRFWKVTLWELEGQIVRILMPCPDVPLAWFLIRTWSLVIFPLLFCTTCDISAGSSFSHLTMSHRIERN